MYWLIWVILFLIYFCGNGIVTLIAFIDGNVFAKRWQNAILLIVLILFGEPLVILYVAVGIAYTVIKALRDKEV